jgi:excisionase family DNA binding protein
MSEEYLTGRELQKKFRISKATMLRWLKAGTLKGVKVGARWRFKMSDIEAMLQPE